jgi:AcrR family transcriptional regulator
MPPTGLRERKKAQTRQRLANTALRLFVERGFDNVTVAEIADTAEVAVSTLFAYFPTKEALVFDQDEAQEQRLAGVVRDRADGVSILDALQTHVQAQLAATGQDRATADQYRELMAATPQLRDYLARISRRWEQSLAVAIADEAGLPDDDVSAAALARYALAVNELSHHAGSDPQAAISLLFDRLRRGWPEFT